MASAARELLATPDQAWAFLAQPYHLTDWWPGVVGVEPDRRGFAPGARWRVVRRGPRGPLRLPQGSWLGRARAETLVIGEVAAPRRFGFELVGQRPAPLRSSRLIALVELDPSGAGRTEARVSVESNDLGSSRDRLTARAAVDRLYALVQTAAGL
jgi:hypothetical protein